MPMSEEPATPEILRDVPRERWPRHIAAIMDGNGRWASRRGLPRMEGHRRGVETVRAVTEECADLGIEQLTLYCLSSENWKRPPEELDFLMQLLRQYMIESRETIEEKNLQLRVIGSRENIPDEVQQEIDETIRLSAENTGTRLCLAINYGGRAEIVRAAQQIAEAVQRGELSPADVTEDLLSDHLYTAGMPEPDLLVRTAGEMRISNFLLWQISYAEIWVTDRCWPEFTLQRLHEAIRDFAARDRKYGGLSDDELV